MKLTTFRGWFGLLGAGLFLIVSAGPNSAQGLFAAQFPPTIIITEGKASQGFPYMFGGISSDEREALEERAKGYNLKLVFAEKRGAFVSGVSLHIGTAKGVELASLTVEGPWFYIQLPPGDYTVKARLTGEVKETKVTVTKDKRAQQSFVWDLGEARGKD